MKKKRLGVSLYPEFASQEDNFSCLERAAAHGFDLLFLAFLGVNDPAEVVKERYRPYTKKAKELGFEIFADVNPWVFDKLGIQACAFKGLDLSFFSDLQIDAMRLDLGMTDLEEAMLTKNKWGIKVCLNGASTVDHVGHVIACGGDPDMLVGCHNYYPHRYTGVSLDYFNAGSRFWKDRGLRLQTFVSSNAPDAFGPWPVTEGLPTLEMHRDLPIGLQTKHYVMMNVPDDILVSNCFATDEELQAMVDANQDRVMFTTRLVDDVPESQVARASMNMSVRSDCTSGYLIRTFETRFASGATEPFNTVEKIERGDVIIDNDLYGQYAGEVQIALKEMNNPGNVNVIGHIDEQEQILLDYLEGGMPFGFNFYK